MTKTLYERLGGAPGIADLVDDIVAAHMVNPTIMARFVPYRDRPEHLAGVKRHICDFFGAGSGGPEQYGGRSMPAAHRGMNISAEEYLATIDDIMLALGKRNLDEPTRQEVLAIAYSLKGEIMRV